eukprot:gb/GEZN01004685.1/.p1 GENE.gb/GEZN01004685.1/~~gb/GEZN01004685.1/.p1  ORF type:complete len:604 (+),score=72.03 gb/GEZN01004685.1/:25-1836(+)
MLQLLFLHASFQPCSSLVVPAGREQELRLEIEDALERQGFLQFQLGADRKTDSTNMPKLALPDLVAAVQLMQDFFALSDSAKLTLRSQREWELGYFPFRAETTNGMADSREVFSMSAAPHTRQALGLDFQACVNHFPSGNATFQTACENLLDRVHSFGMYVCDVFCLALGLPAGCLNEQFRKDSLSELRFVRYLPVSDAGHVAQGVGQHVDSGFVALIFQTSPGLQFFDEGVKAWVDVPVRNDCVVANIGDFAKLLSNGRFHTPLHRVQLGQSERFAMVYFLNPRADVVLRPLVGRPIYQPITWQRYVALRFGQGYSSQRRRGSLDQLLISTPGPLAARLQGLMLALQRAMGVLYGPMVALEELANRLQRPIDGLSFAAVLGVLFGSHLLLSVSKLRWDKAHVIGPTVNLIYGFVNAVWLCVLLSRIQLLFPAFRIASLPFTHHLCLAPDPSWLPYFALYFYSKLFEFQDLCWVQLRGFPISPHFRFHHLTTPILAYLMWTRPTFPAVFFMAANVLMHTILYLYLSWLGLRPIRWLWYVVQVWGQCQLYIGIIFSVLYLRTCGAEPAISIPLFLLFCYAVLHWFEMLEEWKTSRQQHAVLKRE